MTLREFKFLELLFENNKVVSKVEISTHIIGRNVDTSDQRIAVMIARLRKKVVTHSSSIMPIKSDYTNGYVFAGQCYLEPLIEQLPELPILEKI